MSDMEKVTQSGAATAEETAATALELNAQAEALRGVVAEGPVGRHPVAAHQVRTPASSWRDSLQELSSGLG